MKTDREQQVDHLLSAVLERPPSERAAFLAEACADDENLLHEVESLLLKNQAAATLIQSPPASLPPEASAAGKASALTAGNQLGPYKVLSRIGAGGMGEVFLAQDTRLGRKVALKLLPTALVANDELKRRFVQEARAASALNHPNIITIFDIGSDQGRDFIAMEFIEGESLSSVIAHGKVELKRALGLIAQCAAGLAAAHGAGIVHRDIKPDNLMVSRDGHVKILDFGLAKMTERQGPEALNSSLSTFIGSEEAQGGTKPGVILGTVVYMSPEQAQGRPLDPRTDIFSLGVVLYEMLTAKRPFEGNSAIDVLHAIINQEPRPVLEMNPHLPMQVAEILAKALSKDASERYQHVGDFALDLRRLKRAIESNTLPDADVSRRSQDQVRSTRFGLKLATIGVIVVAAAASAGWWLSRSLLKPSGGISLENVTITPLTSDPGYEGEPSLSPNGETVAYVSDRTGDFEIYIQQVSGGTYRNITENKADEVQPAFSPDGQQIAFVSTRLSSSNLSYQGYDLPLMGGDIWLSPVLGGNSRRVAKDGNFPSWSHKGSAIIYTGGPAYGQRIYRVDAQGSEPREIVPKLKSDPRFLLFPSYSSDDHWILFEADPAVLGSAGDIWVMNSESGEVNYIAKGKCPRWSADSRAIIYSSALPGKNFSLWQIPFSSAQGDVSGPAQPLTVSRGRDTHAAMSRDGRLMAFAGIETSFNVETLAFDSEAGRVLGSPEEITSGRKVSYFQSLSPDGKTVVFESREGESTHLWKAERGAVPVQLTTDPNFLDTFPRWSPDGSSIAFNRKPTQGPQASNGLWLISNDGANPRQLIERAGNFAWMSDSRALVYVSPVDLQLHLFNLATKTERRLTDEAKILPIFVSSPDGNWVIFQSLKSGNIDLRAIPVAGGESRTVVETPHQDYHPFLSPSGGWLYFQLDHKNIYRVPGPAQNWRQAAPEKMTDFPESGLLLEDPQISRDGLKLLYSRGRIQGDIWIMKFGR